MTHPIGSLPNSSDKNNQGHDQDLEDSNGTQGSTDISTSLLGTEIVEDYLIVPQDAPLDERPAIYTNGDLYTFLATSIETNFRFNAFDFFVPEGGGPPPHIHNFEHEAFFVEEGQVSFFLGNETGALDIPPGEEREEFILEGLPEGTFIFGPRLRPHGFQNPDSDEAVSGTNNGARIFSFTTPGGLDFLFEFAGIPVEDRDQPILPPPPGIDLKLLELGQRTGGEIASAGYEPPEGTPNYILVLTDDTPQELEDNIRNQVAGVKGFSVFTTSERPTFDGPFGIEYTSLSNLTETKDEIGNKLSYNQFSLAPQATNPLVEAYLNGNQVVEPTQSLATGVANLDLNEAGAIEYSLTIAGLDFGELLPEGTSQTPDNELDDVTAIHIHSGDRGSSGLHKFNLFDPQQQDESDLNIALNDDRSVTISGTWESTEAEIPTDLIDLMNSDGLPGEESDFYFQVHTEGNPEGEIRGQIALTSEVFPDPIVSEDYEAFYVREGTLSFQINDEVRLAEPDTFVYVAPGNEYSFANFSEETVESLAITIPNQSEPDTFFGDSDSDEPFPSPLESQGSVSSTTTFFLGEEADIFERPNGSGRRVYGGNGDDELFANQDDRLFGENGDDILDASSGQNNNRLDGGAGNDELLGGRDGELVGGNGDDILRIVRGGNNLLDGNSGADQFWLANGSLPDTVTETRQRTELGLPTLEDTRNTIADFQLEVDKIGIGGIAGVSSFDDLKLLPTFEDIRSTSIVTAVDGIEGEVSLGNVAGVLFNELSADDFVFA